ncbi:MAG: radical SAM protein [Candidatus Fermentibacteraceae bacterium]|nr:radical SAM protein [Candidatus Fermentibacteraceae bacterium]
MEANKSIIFGPVPSRRLGRSLGLNIIPPKVCSYSCVYCQLGRTVRMQLERQAFYQPERILDLVQDKLMETGKAGEKIDYLTFVPDGEPTLDINLGEEIDLLRPSGVPIAVITNTSLIWRKDVRDALMKADWVSLKIDSVGERVWRKIDRPHRLLELPAILEGALEFAKTFRGKLITETMLLTDVNDSDNSLRETAEFLGILRPATAFLSIPTRPPAEEWVRPPDENALNRAYQIFSEKSDHVEYLIGYEGNTFALTGNVEEDILSITAVHPMRDDAVEEFLGRAGGDWGIIHGMLEDGQLIETDYGGSKFYLRRFSQQQGRGS